MAEIWNRSTVAALAIAGSLLAGCEPKADTSAPAKADAPIAASGSALTGVKPHTEGMPAASDRPGAAAMGAVEAGQARDGAVQGKAAEATAGDGAASTPRP